MLKIQIPEPCHENWNKMLPTTRGAYCEACKKEVIDFTSMSDEEVQHYFLNNRGSNTCGRFQHEQLYRIRIYLPENVFIQKIANWKKYMAVLLLAFGSMLFGCDVETEIKPEGKAGISNIIQTSIAKTDKTFHPNDYVGGMVLTYDSLCLTKKILKQEQYTTYGFTIMIPDITTDKKSLDTSQLKTDTSLFTTPDTTLISTIVSTDTLARKIVADTSGCDGIVFY